MNDQVFWIAGLALSAPLLVIALVALAVLTEREVQKDKRKGG